MFHFIFFYISLIVVFSSPCHLTFAVSDEDNGTIETLSPRQEMLTVRQFNDANRKKTELTCHFMDGVINTQFGNQGKLILTLSQDIRLHCSCMQHDGKILVAGSQTVDETPQFIVLRYNHDGTLDTSFGDNGTSQKGLSFGFVTGIDIQSDNKILMTGFSAMNGRTLIATLRYMPDGNLDSDFGHHGIVTTPIGSYAQAHDITVQSDNKIIVTGTAKVDGLSVFALIRYHHDGNLDYSFGQEGIVTSSVWQGVHCKAHAATVQSDGKIIVAGFANKKLAVARYNQDGTVDTTFDFDSARIPLSEHDSKILRLLIQPDSTISLALLRNDVVTIKYYNKEKALPISEPALASDTPQTNAKLSDNAPSPALPCEEFSGSDSTIKEALEFYKKRQGLSKWQVVAEGIALVMGTFIIIQVVQCARLMYFAGRITGYLSPRKMRHSLQRKARQLGFDINR